nr:MAG TPA: hypothetical protein [Caudoviricetes sp.]
MLFYFLVHIIYRLVCTINQYQSKGFSYIKRQ